MATLKRYLVITVFLIGISVSVNAQNGFQEVDKIFPDTEVENNIILNGNINSFAAVLKEMDDNLKKNDDVCDGWWYKTLKPNFAVDDRRISEIKCLDQIWEIKTQEETEHRMKLCQAKNQQLSGILGGKKATPGQYPHMGALGWEGKNGEWEFKCGSFLVTNRFALTAAHCAKDENTGGRPKIVRFGVLHLRNKMSIANGRKQDVKIEKITPHEMYRPGFKNFDIAVIKLKKRVRFDMYIQPACVLKQRVSKAIITGWGAVSDESKDVVSEELLAAEVDVLGKKQCGRSWRPKRGDDKRYWPIFFRDQLCARRKREGRAADICGGDSGGPLQTKLHINTNVSIHNVIGITAFNADCGSQNFPSVYTDVSFYIDWIEEHIWGEKIKDKKIDKSNDNAVQMNPKETPTKDNNETQNVSVITNPQLFQLNTSTELQWVHIAQNEIANKQTNELIHNSNSSEKPPSKEDNKTNIDFSKINEIDTRLTQNDTQEGIRIHKVEPLLENELPFWFNRLRRGDRTYDRHITESRQPSRM